MEVLQMNRLVQSIHHEQRYLHQVSLDVAHHCDEYCGVTDQECGHFPSLFGWKESSIHHTIRQLSDNIDKVR